MSGTKKRISRKRTIDQPNVCFRHGARQSQGVSCPEFLEKVKYIIKNPLPRFYLPATISLNVFGGRIKEPMNQATRGQLSSLCKSKM